MYRGSPVSTILWLIRFRIIRGIALIGDWCDVVLKPVKLANLNFKFLFFHDFLVKKNLLMSLKTTIIELKHYLLHLLAQILDWFIKGISKTKCNIWKFDNIEYYANPNLYCHHTISSLWLCLQASQSEAEAHEMHSVSRKCRYNVNTTNEEENQHVIFFTEVFAGHWIRKGKTDWITQRRPTREKN